MKRVLVDTVHYEVAESVRISTGLDLLHHVQEKLFSNLQLFEVVATHSLLNGCCFDHAQPNHKHLPFRDIS